MYITVYNYYYSHRFATFATAHKVVISLWYTHIRNVVCSCVFVYVHVCVLHIRNVVSSCVCVCCSLRCVRKIQKSRSRPLLPLPVRVSSSEPSIRPGMKYLCLSELLACMAGSQTDTMLLQHSLSYPKSKQTIFFSQGQANTIVCVNILTCLEELLQW